MPTSPTFPEPGTSSMPAAPASQPVPPRASSQATLPGLGKMGWEGDSGDSRGLVLTPAGATAHGRAGGGGGAPPGSCGTAAATGMCGAGTVAARPQPPQGTSPSAAPGPPPQPIRDRRGGWGGGGGGSAPRTLQHQLPPNSSCCPARKGDSPVPTSQLAPGSSWGSPRHLQPPEPCPWEKARVGVSQVWG